MKSRVKAIFTFDVYVNGEYSNELSFVSGESMTFKQAVTRAKKTLRSLSATHAQIFLAAGSLAVADVTMFNCDITINDYSVTPTQAETYAVCWGGSYKEEDGENNAIATTTDESNAKEIALNESRSNNCTMSVVRMSDKKVILLLSDEVKLTDEATVEFSDLSHAGQCLDIYLHNTREIYDRYTVPAIAARVEIERSGVNSAKNPIYYLVPAALKAAAQLVKKHDHMTPTARDIEQVTRNYAVYIAECAKYEVTHTAAGAIR